jgi:hypothetical protein
MDRQYVGIDFHRRRSVIVRKNGEGEKLGSVRVPNDPLAIAAVVADAGPEPEVVIEAGIGSSTGCRSMARRSISRTRRA